MSDKLTFRLCSPAVRQHASRAIQNAPDGYMVTIQEPKRSLVQNAKLWAMLGDVANQVVWYGMKLSSEDWKDVLTASLRREMRTVPNVEGNGLVVLGMRTSQMSVREMGELIELLYAFGSQHNVKWSEHE